MAKFSEFEIKNFLGIASSNSNPQKNQCQICKNFDLREKSGELVSRQGYRLKYSVPSLTGLNLSSVTYLRATNFVVVRDGVEKEITLLVGKGTLAAADGTSPTPSTLNIGLFFIRPYYDIVTAAWVDGWQWLNQCYLTTISDQGTGASDKNTFRLAGSYSSTDPFFRKWNIYSITKGKYSEIVTSTYVSAVYTTINLAFDPTVDRTVFANSDSVLVMRNFIPYADLQEYYNVLAREISFYMVNNSLRVGFGGKANRLSLMIGFLKNAFLVDNAGYFTSNTGAVTYDEIVIQPYNSLTENAKAAGDWTTSATTGSTPDSDFNVFHLYGDESAVSPPSVLWSVRLTVLLDGYEEFLIPFYSFRDSSTWTERGVYDWIYGADLSTDTIDFTFRFYWALINKRITKIRLYAASADGYNRPISGPYYMVKEWELSGPTYADDDFDLNDFGYLYNKTAFTFNQAAWDNKGKELALSMNYGFIPVDNPSSRWTQGEHRGIAYVRGWDSGVIVSDRPLVANPYDGTDRLLNKVFFAPYSGAGAVIHDALQGGDYINLDTRDGNTLIALGVLPNLDAVAFKKNNIVPIRVATAQVRDSAFGYGLDTPRAIVNLGDRVAWLSQQDVFDTRGAGERNLSEGTIRNLWRAVTSANKLLSFATREELDNSLRFFDPTNKEHLLTQRGWVNIQQYLDPDDYMHSTDGTLWFMDAGYIFYQTGYVDVNTADASQNISLQWKSIPFDIALIGEELTQADRFWIDGIFMKYSSASALTVKVYLDGTLFDTITFSSSDTYDDPAIKYGGIGRVIELEITGTVSAKTTVESIGFRFRPILRGNRV